MTEVGVEYQAVGALILSEAGVVGEEEVGIHALFGVLDTVTVVKRDTAAHVGMPAAIGLRRRQDVPLHVFVVQTVHVGQQVIRFLAPVDHLDIHRRDIIPQQA